MVTATQGAHRYLSLFQRGLLFSWFIAGAVPWRCQLMAPRRVIVVRRSRDFPGVKEAAFVLLFWHVRVTVSPRGNRRATQVHVG